MGMQVAREAFGTISKLKTNLVEGRESATRTQFKTLELFRDFVPSSEPKHQLFYEPGKNGLQRNLTSAKSEKTESESKEGAEPKEKVFLIDLLENAADIFSGKKKGDLKKALLKIENHNTLFDDPEWVDEAALSEMNPDELRAVMGDMYKGKKQADIGQIFEFIARKENHYPEVLEFEERLSEELRETFNELSWGERQMIAELGRAYTGDIVDSPLAELMMDGTLTETDGSGITPLERLVDFGVDGQGEKIQTMLEELLHPEEAFEEEKYPTAEFNPAAFVKERVEVLS